MSALNQVYCHGDHACDEGEHLDGHDECHEDHTCPDGQQLSGHDTCRPLAPENLRVECRAADAKVHATWDAVTGAAYSATVTQTTSGPTAVSQTLAPRSVSSTTMEMDGTAGWTYAVAVTAAIGNNSSDSVSATATCVAVRPPAPTGVTATCQAGALTVTWNTAGTGLAEATSYKPRIFTGDPMAESANWTANTAGHDSATATIPAEGEPALPETGVFQAKVKAANTAGDSPYSDPAKATCGPPGPITGLKCASAADQSLTVMWDTAVGASTYALTGRSGTGRGTHIVYGDQGSGDLTTDTLSDLRDDASYTVKVVATNAKGTTEASVSCRTLDDDWLEVDCAASNSMLHVTWDNSIDGTQFYSVTISNQGSTRSRTTSTASSWVIPGQPRQEYTVGITSTGVPTYSQSKVKSCPELDPFGRKPNPFLWPQEGGIDWPWEHDLDDEYTNNGYATPFLITGVPDYERTCSLSGTTWTCTEHWSEPAKIEINEEWRNTLVANSIQIVEADGLTSTEQTALSNGVNWSIGRIAQAISWTRNKVLKAIIGRATRSTASELNLGEYLLEMGDNNRIFAYIVGPTCLPDTVTQWKPATYEMADSIGNQYTTQVGGYTIKRTYTVHYCKENP